MIFVEFLLIIKSINEMIIQNFVTLWLKIFRKGKILLQGRNNAA